MSSKTNTALSAFEKFASKFGAWSWDVIFDDLLNTMLYLGSHKTLFADEYANACTKYEEQELLQLVFRVTDASAGYNDAIGEIYENIASSGKCSAFGQYFTPQHIVDLMALIVTPQDSDYSQSLADPSGCGSGRNLLVMAKHMGAGRWKHCFEGTDIDIICVKMTIINCLANTIPALVIHGNALSDETWALYEVQLVLRGGAWLPIVVKHSNEVCDAVNEAAQKGVKQKLLAMANKKRIDRLMAIVEEEQKKANTAPAKTTTQQTKLF